MARTALTLLCDAQQKIIDQGPVNLLRDAGYISEETGTFCAVGALYLASNYRHHDHALESETEKAQDALDDAARVIYGLPSAERVNDTLGYSAVLSLYTTAIKELTHECTAYSGSLSA